MSTDRSTDRVTREDLRTAIEWLGAYEVESPEGTTIDGVGACGDPFAESLLRVRARLMAELATREKAQTDRTIERGVLEILRNHGVKPTPNAIALVRGKLDQKLGRG